MKLKKIYNELLAEQVSPGMVEKTLLPHKNHTKGKIQGEVEDYVNVLEFAVEHLASHASTTDEDFERFMGWVNKLTKRGLGDDATLKQKVVQVKKIEKKAQKQDPEEIELDASDVEPIDDKPPPLPGKTKGKAKPPPIPKDHDEEDPKKWFDKEGEPKFSGPAAAPSLKALAGVPDEPEDDDIFAKAAARAAKQKPSSMRDPISKMPSMASLAAPAMNAPAAKALKSKATQDWAPGKKVNVGFHKDMTVTKKRGSAWELEKGGKRYLFEPWSGGIKPIKS